MHTHDLWHKYVELVEQVAITIERMSKKIMSLSLFPEGMKSGYLARKLNFFAEKVVNPQFLFNLLRNLSHTIISIIFG